ncbi:MAG: 50S ribosomal protein L16 [Coriobacteriales bacterium]|nr:50S ribosomal protein L16 [Coriobacteriales bacterium]
MLMPKRVKHRKVQRGSMKGKAKGGTELAFGAFGIQALESHWITNRQIEAARIAMTRHMKRGGRVWITIFPDKPISKKPLETRMGKGKGNPEEWVAVVKPGRIMFEIDGVVEETAREAMRLAMTKLPIKCKMVISPDGPNLNIKSNVSQILAELETETSEEGATEGATDATKQESKEEGE